MQHLFDKNIYEGIYKSYFKISLTFWMVTSWGKLIKKYYSLGYQIEVLKLFDEHYKIWLCYFLKRKKIRGRWRRKIFLYVIKITSSKQTSFSLRLPRYNSLIFCVVFRFFPWCVPRNTALFVLISKLRLRILISLRLRWWRTPSDSEDHLTSSTSFKNNK